ncbi:MAG: hypothetical protein Q9217_002953 [Psora testacea]
MLGLLCAGPGLVCLSKARGCMREGGERDRILDGLSVVPTRMDAMTGLLSCIAMGMQVFKYSPTTGEITLAGVGAAFPQVDVGEELLAHVNSKNLLMSRNLVTSLASHKSGLVETEDTDYVSVAAAWEVIICADQCMSYMEREQVMFGVAIDEVIVRAITPLADILEL